MNEKTFFVLFVFFVFLIFLLNNFVISGRVTDDKFDVSNRFCSDSDNGIEIYSPGAIESDIGTFFDRCLTGENYVSFVGRVVGPERMSIREYYCGEGRHGGEYQVYSKIVQCDIGDNCEKNVDGNADACIKS